MYVGMDSHVRRVEKDKNEKEKKEKESDMGVKWEKKTKRLLENLSMDCH